MVSQFRYTGEVVAGQGEMGDRVDTNHAGLISSSIRGWSRALGNHHL
jgi:hypothetical protein